MKLRVAVCSISLLGVGFCACPVVQGNPVVKTSQSIVARVEKQGKPAADAKVTIFGQLLPQSGLVVKTDAKGMAKIPVLKPGIYTITAEFHGGVTSVAVTVKHRAFAKPSELKLVLEHYPSRVELAAAQNVLVERQSRTLAGVVKDRTGAAIPNVFIQVFRIGDTDEWGGTLLFTDQHGQFAGELPAGKYIAFIQSPGFQSETIAFEISSDATQDTLPAVLHVARAC